MMSIPFWLLDVFAAVMLLVAAVSAVQLVAGYSSRWVHVDADITVSHLLMGIAMAGMLAAYTVRDLDRSADSDGYFHVFRHGPAGRAPVLTAVGAGAGPAPVTPAPAEHAATDGGVATVAQPEAVEEAIPSAQPARANQGGAASLLLAPGVVKAIRVVMGVTMAFMLVITI